MMHSLVKFAASAAHLHIDKPARIYPYNILSQALQTTAVQSESQGDRALINGLGVSRQKQQHAKHDNALPVHASRKHFS